jgi:hypothetical protein
MGISIWMTAELLCFICLPYRLWRASGSGPSGLALIVLMATYYGLQGIGVWGLLTREKSAPGYVQVALTFELSRRAKVLVDALWDGSLERAVAVGGGLTALALVWVLLVIVLQRMRRRPGEDSGDTGASTK